MSLLIAVDDFTRYVISIVLPKLDSRTVRDAFVDRILTVYGRPARVRTDSGREFAGEFAALMDALQIERIRTRPVAPWTNGRAERMVR
jgi:transposase InsO family protein